MDAIYLIKNRKNITNFNNKEISFSVLSEILNCARLTPTNKNAQCWRFIVIKNPQTKEKLSQIVPNCEHFKKANVLVAVFSEDKPFKLEYTSAATESMLISAQHYNIGATWTPSYKQTYSQQVENLLNAPKNFLLMSIIALGYYDFSTSSYSGSQSLSELVNYEKFK